MKHLLLLALGLGAATAQAQSTEFTLHATSGYFGYRGALAEGPALIIGNDGTTGGVGFTTLPYGKRFTLSYGGAGQVQRATAHHLVLGAHLGYEWLRSRVQVAALSTSSFSSRIIPASGQTTFTGRFVNTHVFVGHRFGAGSFHLDATLGPELGVRLSEREKGEASGGGFTVRTNNRISDDTKLDLRARANLTAYYQRLGLSVCYSYGLLDYERNYDGGTGDLYSQMLRVGLAYRL
ncbi:hypothetical protein CDA63_10150 [Hymenobacter amundsenii]|uniref:Outer membrane protein beta-barrel domain-containing protein n=1 Tax=Hymenobacter amundsenii TaxID=2006685 RepID=A0A2D0AFS1_9BACT|nr:hypothetical protein [Hymenobacter amundsenii]OWP63209.1 hypothetical protein CDA63_10150 [Hymenobacter amundsenii]